MAHDDIVEVCTFIEMDGEKYLIQPDGKVPPVPVPKEQVTSVAWAKPLPE